ncbi:hypothetical protein [Nocardioides sp. BYT-33-1]|uniref:hypothetical protein n=1 Tax=Nocardioides sp. BYT-33-1 TaxID=3416952 RepID=UPI003F52AC9B
MKLSLFHAPYVDADGRDRMRLSGVLTGANPDTDGELIKSVKDALVKCSEESTILVVDDSIEVGWL